MWDVYRQIFGIQRVKAGANTSEIHFQTLRKCLQFKGG